MDVRGKSSNGKRLIDADALYSEIEDEYDLYYGEIVTNPRRFAEMVEDAPTVDAVEVVRCRDCNHCDQENHHCDHYMGTVAPLSRKPDDFCSYGERKDGDGND